MFGVQSNRPVAEGIWLAGGNSAVWTRVREEEDEHAGRSREGHCIHTLAAAGGAGRQRPSHTKIFRRFAVGQKKRCGKMDARVTSCVSLA